MFDPGGSQGRFRVYSFLGSWRALLCREVVRVGAAGDELQRYSEEIRWLFEARPALMLCQRKSRRRERSETKGETNGGQTVEGGSR